MGKYPFVVCFNFKYAQKEGIFMYHYYYVNKLTTGNPNFNHEVHKSNCYYLPSESNREYLGYFNSCAEAIQTAKRRYFNVDGCAVCCPECHKQ